MAYKRMIVLSIAKGMSELSKTEEEMNEVSNFEARIQINQYDERGRLITMFWFLHSYCETKCATMKRPRGISLRDDETCRRIVMKQTTANLEVFHSKSVAKKINQ